MDQTRGERRAETARQNDDSDIIEAVEDEALDAPAQQGREGGNLQADVATRAEEDRATAPDTHESVKKGDHIAQGHGESPPHPAAKAVTERD